MRSLNNQWGADKDECQRLRKELEQYNQEKVMPCVRRASQHMASHADPLIMHKLMELVISYENSADGTISNSMGKLFATDPATVERGLKEFPVMGRRLIADSVQTGWTNVKAGLAAACRKNRDERLKKLLASLGRKVGTAPIQLR